jgi:hypothetical protein
MLDSIATIIALDKVGNAVERTPRSTGGEGVKMTIML